MAAAVTKNNKYDDQDNFFDLLSRFQSKRMDDQRCSLRVRKSEVERESSVGGVDNANVTIEDAQNDLLDLIMGIQSKRMDEQRVELPNLPGLCRSSFSAGAGLPKNIKNHESIVTVGGPSSNKKSTVPDEDFFSLISRLQSGRMDDQRARLKKL